MQVRAWTFGLCLVALCLCASRMGYCCAGDASAHFVHVRCQSQGDFTATAIPDSVFERMRGKSFPEGCTVSRSELRYLQVLHVDAEGVTHRGELVCHQSIASALLDIFQQLYEGGYPIERMRLIDDYEADDERSMQDNNTSCFCFRPVTGGKGLSRHATGMAVDINPRYNPYVAASGVVKPANALHSGPYRIWQGDLCHRLFLSYGFTWGGSWRRTKDYQHFQR